ncbi:hypothetical protein KDL29_03805 [bacterium]|nr:hypothetical protein [bacterium]
MYDGNRSGAYRHDRHGFGDRVAASLLASLSLEGIINMLVALAIILALLNYVIIPQFRTLGGNVRSAQAVHDTAPPGEIIGDRPAN